MSELTLDQKATNYETMKHIMLVQKNLHTVCKHLLNRAEDHDASKLTSPEVEIFTEETKHLAGLTYGSPEYAANLKRIAPALEHHYANNRHHANHFKNGVNDMNLVDVIEMYCDWAASCKRHNDGNLNKSIEHNADRYSLSPQLVKIFENSTFLFGE